MAEFTKIPDFGELQGFALRIIRCAVYSTDIIIANPPAFGKSAFPYHAPLLQIFQNFVRFYLDKYVCSIYNPYRTTVPGSECYDIFDLVSCDDRRFCRVRKPDEAH